MKAPVYNLEGQKVSEVELSEALFNRPWNADLVQQVVVAQAANARRPWAHAKGRGEVRGGGRKPWKQKHTGRARQGSIRSPIWKGGGVSHGPVKTRSYVVKINKKMLRGALSTLISLRLRDGELKIVDALPTDIVKTKALTLTLQKLSPALHALLVPASGTSHIYRSSRNVPHLKALAPESLNVADLLRYKNILLDKSAIAVLERLG